MRPFAILILLCFLIPLTPASWATVSDVEMPAGQGATPIDLDVWVNGQHSARTSVGGVPIRGNMNNVYVDLLPYFYGTDLVVQIQVIPLVSGTHTVGIGHMGHNAGVVMEGPIGQVLDAEFVYLGAAAALLYGQSCDRSFEATIGKTGLLRSSAPLVKAIQYTKGNSFSILDEIFIHGRSPTDLYVSDVAVRVADCGHLLIEATIPYAVTHTDVYFGDGWHVHTLDAPREIRIDEETDFNWDGGYRVSMSAATSGVISGVVEKFNQEIDITGTFSGLHVAEAKWGASQPWLYLGLKFWEVGGSAHVRADVVDVRATLLQNGNIYFQNDSVFANHELARGTCATAFWGSLVECHLT